MLTHKQLSAMIILSFLTIGGLSAKADDRYGACNTANEQCNSTCNNMAAGLASQGQKFDVDGCLNTCAHNQNVCTDKASSISPVTKKQSGTKAVGVAGTKQIGGTTTKRALDVSGSKTSSKSPSNSASSNSAMETKSGGAAAGGGGKH